jgi:hypothetical protein
MVTHVVLFRPRPDLTDRDRRIFVAALERALCEIPSIRRANIGRRVRHGQAYESAMVEDLEYGAVLEFDDLAGLRTYLEHPAHIELGERFNKSIAAACVYDYEMQVGTDLTGPLAIGGA